MFGSKVVIMNCFSWLQMESKEVRFQTLFSFVSLLPKFERIEPGNGVMKGEEKGEWIGKKIWWHSFFLKESLFHLPFKKIVFTPLKPNRG